MTNTLHTDAIAILFVAPNDSDVSRPLSAASGLALSGHSLWVAADDEAALARFDLDHLEQPGRFVLELGPELPQDEKARKRAKRDWESLMPWPPVLPTWPHGGLVVWGSASRQTRMHAWLLPWADATQCAFGLERSREVDTKPLMQALARVLDELNIEGAWLREGGDGMGVRLNLLQRGNRGAGLNARIEFAWLEVLAWMAGTAATPPQPLAAPQTMQLPSLRGGASDSARIPLGFTDACALPAPLAACFGGPGAWIFCAAAEATDNAFHDGATLGSAIGVFDAQDRLRALAVVDRRCKVEGLALDHAQCTPESLALLLVTDADDRHEPAALLRTTLAAPITMQTNREFVTSRVLLAPRSRVFEALRDPALLTRWWGPAGFRNTFETFDFRPGGDWRFTMHAPDGAAYPNHSVFAEIVEGERVVFDHVLGHRFRMTITLEGIDENDSDDGAATLLRWRQVFDSAEERERIAAFVIGANEENLDRLAQVLSDA
jgi:uncharacterized protein YndB with AHSA1/START domain